MRVAALAAADDFDGWRDAARSLAAQHVPPADVVWQVGDLPTDLCGDEAIVAGDAPPPVCRVRSSTWRGRWRCMPTRSGSRSSIRCSPA